MDSSTVRHRRRPLRLLAAGLGAALLLAGCGFNAQTLQEYTPARGVNIDEGNIKVRNLLVVANEDGTGIVSASLVSSRPDELTAVAGTPTLAGGVAGSPLQVTLASPVILPANQLVVLTDQSPTIDVSSPDLTPGLQVELELTFASGAVAKAAAPVASFDDPLFQTASPTGTAVAPTAEATASPAAEGDGEAATEPAAEHTP